MLIIGLLLKKNIFISNRTQTSSQVWKDLGYENAFINNQEMTEASWSPDPKFWIVLIAVKPQTRFTLFNQLKDDMTFDRITRSFVENQLLFISILAGIDTQLMRNEYSNSLFYNGPILRVNPNVASAYGSGTTLICTDASTPRRFVEIGKELFSAVGIVKEIPENIFDAACAISGSGPAFVSPRHNMEKHESNIFRSSLSSKLLLMEEWLQDSLEIQPQNSLLVWFVEPEIWFSNRKRLQES